MHGVSRSDPRLEREQRVLSVRRPFMTSESAFKPAQTEPLPGSRHVARGVLAIAACALCAFGFLRAQDTQNQIAPTPSIDGYIVHQSIQLGGHIVEHSGSDFVYDTLVNLQSGPRI